MQAHFCKCPKISYIHSDRIFQSLSKPFNSCGASFNNPGQIAAGPDGSLFIADTNNNRIRRIDPAGVISTVVGKNGEFVVSSAENTEALATPINGPSGLALAADGSLYFTDRYNQRVRKLMNGVVNTVAGTGDVGRRDGPALTATFSAPFGLAVDSADNVYIADYGNELVRKLAAQMVSTFAGNGQYRPLVEAGPAANVFLSHPTHAARDTQGNIYVADTDNARVLRVSASDRSTTTFAGKTTDGKPVNGRCTPSSPEIQLNFPASAAVDTSGNVYVSDFGPNIVYRITPDRRICPYAGGGSMLFSGSSLPATNLSLGTIIGIALDGSGNLFIADADNNRVWRVDPRGSATVFAGNGQRGFSGDNGPAANASLKGPYGVAVDKAGNVYIADRFNSRIRKVTPNCLTGASNCIITTVAGNATSGFGGIAARLRMLLSTVPGTSRSIATATS